MDASTVAWFVERETRKPTIATVAVATTLTIVAAALISAGSTEELMPGCYGRALGSERLNRPVVGSSPTAPLFRDVVWR
jgi:hypothetical protein